ncbi:hypothetical protein [Vulgatibacter sp.]|uniref:hypothetical protein n=1 Tax=Vulgatibacter sp. TaxID=1971226 RepID=UPI00356A7B23
MRWWNPLLIALAAGCADGATLQERGDGQEARPCEAACLPGCTFANDATQPRWRYEPPAGTRISFPAIADEAGTLYWRERGDECCATVAADLDGLVHYRAASPCLSGEVAMLRRGELLLTQGSEVILAHATADGSLAWRHELAQSAGCETSLEEVAASDEVLYAIRSERCGEGGLLLWATDRSWPDGEEVRTSRLVELEGDGSVRRACAAASGVGHLAVLRDGLLITQGAGGLAAYVVPGLAEAARGWSSAGGGPSRGGWER